MVSLAQEAFEIVGISSNAPTHQHKLSKSFLSRQENNILKIITTLRTYTNPFADECQDLINLVTKRVMSDKISEHVCNRNAIESEQMEKFVMERISGGNINLWAPMQKLQLKMFTDNSKKISIQSAGKVIELKEDRALFCRMLIVSKIRPEIDLKDAIGNYEFSVVPRSMVNAPYDDKE
jgi:hypothetical protein